MDALSVAIAAEPDQPGDLVAIEGLDGHLETVLWIDFVNRREGVVDEFGPAFFLESDENDFLIGSWDAVALDNLAAVTQFTPGWIPFGCGLAVFFHDLRYLPFWRE